MGVRAPESEERDMGRGGGTISVRDDGRAYDDILARELGRLASESGLRFGSGPKDRRLIPEVLSLGTWLGFGIVVVLGFVGVVSSPATDDEAVDPTVRFRERMVIEDGIVVVLELKSLRGEARGGV